MATPPERTPGGINITPTAGVTHRLVLREGDYQWSRVEEPPRTTQQNVERSIVDIATVDRRQPTSTSNKPVPKRANEAVESAINPPPKRKKKETGGRVYECDKCPYTTAFSFALKNHKELHEKADSVVCSLCKVVVHPKSVKQHNTKYHSTGPTSGENLGTLEVGSVLNVMVAEGETEQVEDIPLDSIREATAQVSRVAPPVPVAAVVEEEGLADNNQPIQHARDPMKPLVFGCTCGETFRTIRGIEDHIQRFQN